MIMTIIKNYNNNKFNYKVQFKNYMKKRKRTQIFISKN
jgi:hypothetical protein